MIFWGALKWQLDRREGELLALAGTEPRGSKYPRFKDSGPQNHTMVPKSLNIGYLDPLGNFNSRYHNMDVVNNMMILELW